MSEENTKEEELIEEELDEPTEQKEKKKIQALGYIKIEHHVCMCGHEPGLHDNYKECILSDCECEEYRELGGRSINLNPETLEQINTIPGPIKERVRICKCGHRLETHDKHGICDADECDCLTFNELELSEDSEGNIVLPEFVEDKLIRERIPSVLRPRKQSPILEQATLSIKVALLDIGHTIPQTDQNPSAAPRYMDVDLEKLEIHPNPALSPEDNYKNLTEDEITLEEIAKDYGTTKDEARILNEQRMRTAKVVESCSITELQEKIEELEKIGLIVKAMEQSCRIIQGKKLSEETRANREARIAREKEQYEKDKAEGKIRRVGRPASKSKDGNGSKTRVSGREKRILRLTNAGFSRAKAEKMVDSIDDED